VYVKNESAQNLARIARACIIIVRGGTTHANTKRKRNACTNIRFDKITSDTRAVYSNNATIERTNDTLQAH
jgi:hypothetical protein